MLRNSSAKSSIIEESTLRAAREEVEEDRRRDRGQQAHRRRDQRLGDAGCDDGEVRRARCADLAERVHDAPHRPEQADERRDTLAVVARKLSRRSMRVTSTVAARASERESDSRLLTVGRAAAPGGAGRRPAHLLVDLEVAGLEDADERARAQLRADGVHLRELAALAEDLEERRRLRVRAVERDPLVEDDRPRDQGEDEQEQQDGPGDPAAVGDQPGDAGGERRRLGLGQQRGGSIPPL